MYCDKCKSIPHEKDKWLVALCPLHAAAGEMLEACKAHIDEWHSTFRNMERREPRSLKLARAAIAKAEK